MTTQRADRGIRNNNPGNIERVKGTRWQGELPVAEQMKRDNRFVVFEAPEFGVRAIARTLITYQDKRQAADGSKIDTIREIIERWAPAGENNVDTYAKHVSELTDIGVSQTLDVYQWNTMKPLVKAIIAHECSGYQYPEAVIDNGLVKAGLAPPAEVVASGNAKTTAAIGVGAGVVGAVLAALPAAKETYDQVAVNASALSEVASWLPVVLGLVAAGAVLYLAAHNISLKARLQ
jgi:hypothetical protein